MQLKQLHWPLQWSILVGIVINNKLSQIFERYRKIFFSGVNHVIQIMKLILVMPATKATSEIIFSAIRRLKTWLRTTTSQARLNWCMLLHVHKERPDSLPLEESVNEFVSYNESRKHLFGRFPDKSIIITS